MRSIQNKVFFAIAFSLILISGSTLWFMTHHEKNLIEQIAQKKTRDIANMYFDGVNTLMLTGTMSQRETLRQKFLQDSDIKQIKIIRSEAVNKLLHNGKSYEQASTPAERQALKGKEYITTRKENKERIITLLYPLKASANYHGVNCLGCHQVKEGTVLGAVRVDYSLKTLDKKVSANFIAVLLSNIAFIIAGSFILLWLLRIIILTPLKNITRLIDQAEKNNDLSIRCQSSSRDEIGVLSQALNKMFQRFDQSMQEVVQRNNELDEQIRQISSMSEQTVSSIRQQQQQTNEISAAIDELDNNVSGLNRTAQETAESAQKTNDIAQQGKQYSQQASNGITQMVTHLKSTEQVIAELNQKTQNITDVLDVIRNLAEQTNLLALNAAIEAARAGESGRGFAVVADEVRNLATRSHESTTEIENIITELQEQAKQAVEYMAQSIQESNESDRKIGLLAENMEKIVEQMNRVNSHNEQLLQIAGNQQNISQNVSHNMQQINQLSGQSSQNAQKTLDISKKIEQLSQKLEQLVCQFRRSA